MSKRDCHQALEKLHEYLDGELPPADARDVQIHIETCDSCYPELRLSTELRNALHRAAQGQPCCPEGLRDRIARLIEQERVGARLAARRRAT
jgi:anti-sigma factor (TIGR02949 family)